MDAGLAFSDGAALWLSIPLLAAAQLWPAYLLRAAGIWGLYGITSLTPPGEALLKPPIQVPYYTKPDRQRPICDTEGPESRTSSPAAHNQTSAVWPDHDRVYPPIGTSPKAPIDIYTTTVSSRPIGSADDVPKSDIKFHQLTERNPVPDDINHNSWGGYTISAAEFAAGWALLAILVSFWRPDTWINLRSTIGAVRRTLRRVIWRRVQYWFGKVHQQFANAGSSTDSIQGAWKWLSSRFEHKSQQTSKSDQDLPLSKYHQSGVEARPWHINPLFGLLGQDPHSFVQRASALFILFMVSAFCLFHWFLPKVYSMLSPLGYAFQVWALVSSVISSAIYNTITCLSQLVRCTETVYYNPIYPDGSYVPLFTSNTFTGFVCRQIDSYILFLRGIVRGIPLSGNWNGTEAIEHIRSAEHRLEYTTRSARDFIGCLPFFVIVSNCRCSFWAHTLNRAGIIVLLTVIGILNCSAVSRWHRDPACMTQQRMRHVVFDCILILGPFSILAYSIWNILQNLSLNEIIYVVTTLSTLILAFSRESTVDWWDRFLVSMRLAPARSVSRSHD